MDTDRLLAEAKANYRQVLDFDQNYLIVVGIFFIATVIFVCAVVIIYTCQCCCALRAKAKAKQKMLRCDSKHDSCRRKTFTSLLALLTMALM